MKPIARHFRHVSTLVAKTRARFLKAGRAGLAHQSDDTTAACDYLYARPGPLPTQEPDLLRRAAVAASAAYRLAKPRIDALYARSAGFVADRFSQVRPLPPGAYQRAIWHLNRARCMTPIELAHRGVRAARARGERFGLFAPAELLQPAPSPAGRPWLSRAAAVDPAPYLAAAEEIVAGRIDLFALQGVELGSRPRWNRDPRTGTEAPLLPAASIDYRDTRMAGDVKYLWELNRHGHLLTLAQAFALSGDPRFLQALRLHLESWLAACPYGKGVNWSSPLEAAVRLINWSATWHLLGGAASPAFEDAQGALLLRRWLRSVHQHAHFVRGRLSLHSSANYQLIGEAAGLFIAAVTWPGVPRAAEDRARAQAILEREVRLQNGADGVNREQALCCQHFELDVLVAALLAGRASGDEFSGSYAARLEAMLGFLASIMDASGNVPMLGDSDEGTVAPLAREPGFCRSRSLLATGAILFGRADFKAKARVLDDRTLWLLGNRAREAFDRLAAAPAGLPARRAFEDGGYYVLGSRFESEDEIRLVADAGPVGYGSIAAHGHADALSFTLSVGGEELFVDPGTYAFHAESDWRAYFRGTAAHNTVRVDAHDQSEPGGNFMWLRKARAECTLWSVSAERDIFEGWHDGYVRLDDPVKHWRRITLRKHDRRLIVEDTLEMARTHLIELFFHCSERCQVARDGQAWIVKGERRSVSLSLPQRPGASVHVLFGNTAPICGWMSRGYDRKVPAPTLVWQAWLTGTAVLRTEIQC
jgi:hypothetical protein